MQTCSPTKLREHLSQKLDGSETKCRIFLFGGSDSMQIDPSMGDPTSQKYSALFPSSRTILLPKSFDDSVGPLGHFLWHKYEQLSESFSLILNS